MALHTSFSAPSVSARRLIPILGVALLLSAWSVRAASLDVLEDDHDDDHHDDDHSDEDHDEHDEHSSTEAWLNAIGATLVVSIIGLIGIVAVIFKVNIVERAREAIGFAVGTLLGAVAFVFMPEVSDTIGFGVGGASSMLAGMLAAFTLEFLVHSGHGHSHPHGHLDDIERNASTAGTAGDGFSTLEANPDDSTAEGKATKEAVPLADTSAGPTAPVDDPESPTDTKSSQAPSAAAATSKSTDSTYGTIRIAGKDIKSYALVNIAGDLIHNFVDGALIGLTMRDGTRTGWVTALAIAAHEIPQELADFSILVQSGMSTRTALLVNFLTGLSAIFGAILALAIGEAVDGDSSWALAFSAGLFLYLALADLVPQIVSHGRALQEQLRVAAAVAVGLGLMALLLLLPREAHSHGGEDDHADDGH